MDVVMRGDSGTQGVAIRLGMLMAALHHLAEFALKTTCCSCAATSSGR